MYLIFILFQKYKMSYPFLEISGYNKNGERQRQL